MVTQESIERACREIVEQFQPERIVLFGSYAYGTPHEGSDVDLLVVMPYTGHPARKSVEIMLALKTRIPVEVLVRTPEQVKRRIDQNDSFMTEITRKGRVIYERVH